METSSATRALYVGNLPKDLENPEDVLMNIFSKVGMILSIKMCRDINTHNSLGYAYVNFQNPADAERAQQQLNYTELPGRPGHELRVQWSSRDPTSRKRGAGNLFIKNLDPEMTNKQIHELFSQYGPVLSCAQAIDNNGKRLGYGMVHFQNEESANNASEALNNKEVNGNVLSVQLFIRRSEREKEAEKTFRKIFVKNISSKSSESEVKSVFSAFGTVVSLFLNAHQKFPTKFALIEMSSHDEAIAAIENLDGDKTCSICSPDLALYVCRCRKKTERKHATSNMYQNEGRNLYVKHLPDDITEERLRADFSPFGEIESVCLQVTEDGVFRGFAFVCFKTKESAEVAVRQLHQKVLYGRPLYVMQAQRRDARHKMLEEQTRMMFMEQSRTYPLMGMYPPHMMQTPFPGGMPMMPMRMSMQNFPMRRQPTRSSMNPAMRSQPKMMVQPRPQMYTNVARMQNPENNDNIPPSMLVSMVSNMSPEERKNALGERLYAQIVHLDANQAAKITGMLLEMDNSEILNVLEDHNMLRNKVEEAQQVLRQHEAGVH